MNKPKNSEDEIMNEVQNLIGPDESDFWHERDPKDQILGEKDKRASLKNNFMGDIP